jgi:hypothetical protein
MSEAAKSVQFQLARAVTRKKFEPLRPRLIRLPMHGMP